jgi:Serine hydrolase
VGWPAETTPEVLLADVQSVLGPDAVHDWATRVSVPTLVIHGGDDRISPLTRAQSLASETGAELVVLEGAGHVPLARDPVRVNLLIREFADKLAGTPVRSARWARARHRRRRALFVSSPIGLGHARRDIAIACELRRHHPDLEIDWLVQHPVTRMLQVTVSAAAAAASAAPDFQVSNCMPRIGRGDECSCLQQIAGQEEFVELVTGTDAVTCAEYPPGEDDGDHCQRQAP